MFLQLSWNLGSPSFHLFRWLKGSARDLPVPNALSFFCKAIGSTVKSYVVRFPAKNFKIGPAAGLSAES